MEKNAIPKDVVLLPHKNGSVAKGKVIAASIEKVREFREMTREQSFNTDAYQARYKETETACNGIDALQLKLEDTTDAAEKERLSGEIEKGKAHLQKLRKQLLDADVAAYERQARRVFSILVFDGDQPAFEDIDWDKADLEEVQKGASFFRMKFGDLPNVMAT